MEGLLVDIDHAMQRCANHRRVFMDEHRTFARSCVIFPSGPRHCPFVSETVSPSGNFGVTVPARNAFHCGSPIVAFPAANPK